MTSAERLATFAQEEMAERSRLRVATTQMRTLQEELNAAQTRLQLYEHLETLTERCPPWLLPTKIKSTQHHAIVCLLLSDAHFDEVVNPAEVEGSNAYNREIAQQRLRRILERVIRNARGYLQGLTYDGLVLMLGGDMLSGSIHEELLRTNADTVLGSVDFWVDPMVGFIRGLQEEFKQVRVVGVVGNHGRLTDKPVAKTRVRDNLDWLLYRTVARLTPEVSWDIPESADASIQVYDVIYRLTHGDQTKGGGGISGEISPLMITHHRKAKRQMALGHPFNWLVQGHWHRLWSGKGLIVNGSVIGYNEYAYSKNFEYERPQQQMWITTPEHGATIWVPIFADDRKSEKW